MPNFHRQNHQPCIPIHESRCSEWLPGLIGAFRYLGSQIFTIKVGVHFIQSVFLRHHTDSEIIPPQRNVGPMCFLSNKQLHIGKSWPSEFLVYLPLIQSEPKTTATLVRLVCMAVLCQRFRRARVGDDRFRQQADMSKQSLQSHVTFEWKPDWLDNQDYKSESTSRRKVPLSPGVPDCLRYIPKMPFQKDISWWTWFACDASK